MEIAEVGGICLDARRLGAGRRNGGVEFTLAAASALAVRRLHVPINCDTDRAVYSLAVRF